MPLGNSQGLLLGNVIALDELTRIEERAHRSRTAEAETILRLAAALREAMQVRENAFAIMAALNVANLKHEKESNPKTVSSHAKKTNSHRTVTSRVYAADALVAVGGKTLIR
jgi:hypothetical protein